MARKKEPMEFSGALEVQAQKPLDGRRRVSFIADLTDAKSYPYIFKGLDVFCEENEKWYTFLGGDSTDANNWREEGSGSGGNPDWSNIQNKPENIVTDENYVHTDNNYSNEDKDKLDSIQPGETVTQEWNEQNRSIDMTVGTQTVQQMVLTGIAMKSDIAEAMTDVDNEHFHPVTVLPDIADEDPTKRPKENHEYILIEYEQDGTTIKSETHYLFYGGAYHQKSTGGVSLDGYATEDFVNTKTAKMGEFDVTPIPQGPTGANEINAVLSNKDNEYARLSYVRQSDGTLPNTVNLGVKSGLGDDSFELPTKRYADDALSALGARVTDVENQFSTRNYIFADALLLDVDLPHTMPWSEFSAMGFPQSTLQENTVYNVVTFNGSYDKEYPKIRYFNDSQEGAIKTIRYKLDERQSSASSEETLVVEYDIANQTATITTGGTAGINKSHIKVYSPRSVYGVSGKVSEDFDLRVLEEAATHSEVASGVAEAKAYVDNKTLAATGWGVAKTGVVRVNLTNNQGSSVVSIADLNLASVDDYSIAATVVSGGTGAWGQSFVFTHTHTAAQFNLSVNAEASGQAVDFVDVKYTILAKGYGATGGGGGIGTVDTAMSDTSENAVQNKVIKEYVDNIQGLPSGGANGQILARNSMSPDNAEWIDNPSDNTFVFDVDSDQFTEDADNPDGKHYGMTITSPTYDELLAMLQTDTFVYARLLYNSGNAYEIMQLFHNANSIYGRYFDVEFPQKRLQFASAYVNKRNNDTYFGTYQDYIGAGGETVDQTYDATSTNAQSGTAVAEAVGDLSSLTTTAQDNLVNAVNELKSNVSALGEPFRVKQWGSNTLNVEIPYCTEDIANGSIPKMVFSIDDAEGADYQIVGMVAYEVFDAASGGNRINCWPVCQFTGNGQKELSVRWMCGGTTRKTAKRINAWVLLKHR